MTPPDPRERLWDLLADKATVGLTPPEEAELRALLDQHPDVDPDDLERVAAALELGNPLPREPLPAELRQRIEREAAAQPLFAASPPSRLGTPEPPRLGWLAASGWLAAAASLLALIGLWYATRPAPAVSPEVALAHLLERPGTVRVKGTPPEMKPGGGEVVWNPATQEGFLRLRDLPVNDPSRRQYQLWIIDASRDKSPPVDGGVFDVPRDGEVVVPFRPRLPVGKAAAFAITSEVPGGVVVSDQKDVALVAAVP